MDEKQGVIQESPRRQSPPVMRTEPNTPRLPPPWDLMRMLVVDSSIFSWRLRRHVHQRGLPVRVLTAICGSDAVRSFARYSPDLIVLEIQLLDTSGFDLLVQFKQHRPECVVIILTAHAYPNFEAHALRLGADFFFSKATDLERIVEVIAATARRRRPAQPPLSTAAGTHSAQLHAAGLRSGI